MNAALIESNPQDFHDFGALHALISEAFADMAGRIDPPSSIAAMGPDALRDKAAAEDLLLIRQDGQPIACLFGVVRGDAYYIGKLAVAQTHRHKGLARALIAQAAVTAHAKGCAALELQTRVELIENHATFTRLGFIQTGATSHPGYTRPTSLTFRRPL